MSRVIRRVTALAGVALSNAPRHGGARALTSALVSARRLNDRDRSTVFDDKSSFSASFTTLSSPFAVSWTPRDAEESSKRDGGARATTYGVRGMRMSAHAEAAAGHERSGSTSDGAHASDTSTSTSEYDETVPRGAKAEALDSANDGRALKAVHTAIGCNAAILVCKMGAYGVSGSPSMLAESIHSVADIVNQVLLQVGITNSNKKPDAKFNYGYRRERFVYSLISAVGIFFLGAGFSVMHGVHGLMDPMPTENLWVAISVLSASAALEGYSLKVAYEALRDNAKAQDMTLTEFIKSGKDPTSLAVFAEDTAAVLGCGIATTALLACYATGNPMYDSMGSIAVGGLLGATALYLINSNRLLLLGRSLGEDKMDVITAHMRRDPVVEEVYFAKSEELGAGAYRFAVEVEFSGKKIVERYLAKHQRRMALHSKFSAANDPKALDAALVQYGEDIVQAVGDEVDRLEKEIVEIEPSIHYVDIETN